MTTNIFIAQAIIQKLGGNNRKLDGLTVDREGKTSSAVENYLMIIRMNLAFVFLFCFEAMSHYVGLAAADLSW